MAVFQNRFGLKAKVCQPWAKHTVCLASFLPSLASLTPSPVSLETIALSFTCTRTPSQTSFLGNPTKGSTPPPCPSHVHSLLTLTFITGRCNCLFSVPSFLCLGSLIWYSLIHLLITRPSIFNSHYCSMMQTPSLLLFTYDEDETEKYKHPPESTGDRITLNPVFCFAPSFYPSLNLVNCVISKASLGYFFPFSYQYAVILIWHSNRLSGGAMG